MRIGVLSSNPTFTGPVIEELRRRGHKVIIYRHSDDERQNAYQVGQLVKAGRVNANFVDFAQMPWASIAHETDMPLTVRMHRIEVYDPENYALQLQTGQQTPPPWPAVNNLVFVAEHVQERFIASAKERGTPLPQNMHLIEHVGVDLATFGYVQRDWSELPMRLLMAGNAVPKKRQYTTVEMMKDVENWLPGAATLTIIGGGGMPGYGNAEYHINIGDLVRHLDLSDVISVVAPCPHEEMPGNMGRAHAIVSSSNEEGCATVVAEAMATGAIPIVKHWRGAEKLYPEEWLWDTPAGFMKLVRKLYRASPAQAEEWSRAMRQWVVERFDQGPILARLCDLIQAVPKPVFYSSLKDHMIEQADNPRNQLQGNILLSECNPNTRFLEVGCGVGRQTELLATAGIQRVVGVDIARDLIFQAQSSAQAKQLQIQYELVEEGPEYKHPEGPYDLVAMLDVIEHVGPDKWEMLLGQAVAVMEDNGVLLISFPYQAQKPELHQQIVEHTVFPKWLMADLKELGLTVTWHGPYSITSKDSDYLIKAVRK